MTDINHSNDRFDCVEMKHKAAAIIRKKISKMSREEELKYWHDRTKFLTKRQIKNNTGLKNK